MGKDYRNSHNLDKKFRGKRPDKVKKGKTLKKEDRQYPDDPDASIDFDSAPSRFDGRRY